MIERRDKWGYSLSYLRGLLFVLNMLHLLLGIGGGGARLSDISLYTCSVCNIWMLILFSSQRKCRKQRWKLSCTLFPKEGQNHWVQSPSMRMQYFSFQFVNLVFKMIQKTGGSVVVWILIMLLLLTVISGQQIWCSLDSSYCYLPNEDTRLGMILHSPLSCNDTLCFSM